MKNECSIVQDIMPLYVEEMVSDDTVSFVREHLKDCPRCRAELEKLQKEKERLEDQVSLLSMPHR